MKIEKTVNMDIDVEVDVSLDDITWAIGREVNAVRGVLQGINNCHTFLKAIPDAVVAEMTDKQKQTIYDAMLLQVNRYSTTSNSCASEKP